METWRINSMPSGSRASPIRQRCADNLGDNPYQYTPRKCGCTLLSAAQSVTLHFILRKAAEPLHNDFLCWIRERTFPFFLTRNLISGKKAIRWRKCYLLEWFHFCHHHLPPPPNIHTENKEKKPSRILLVLRRRRSGESAILKSDKWGFCWYCLWSLF